MHWLQYPMFLPFQLDFPLTPRWAGVHRRFLSDHWDLMARNETCCRRQHLRHCHQRYHRHQTHHSLERAGKCRVSNTESNGIIPIFGGYFHAAKIKLNATASTSFLDISHSGLVEISRVTDYTVLLFFNVRTLIMSSKIRLAKWPAAAAY